MNLKKIIEDRSSKIERQNDEFKTQKIKEEQKLLKLHDKMMNSKQENKRRAKLIKLNDKMMNLKLKKIKEEQKLLKLNVKRKNTKRKKEEEMH